MPRYLFFPSSGASSSWEKKARSSWKGSRSQSPWVTILKKIFIRTARCVWWINEQSLKLHLFPHGWTDRGLAVALTLLFFPGALLQTLWHFRSEPACSPLSPRTTPPPKLLPFPLHSSQPTVQQSRDWTLSFWVSSLSALLTSEQTPGWLSPSLPSWLIYHTRSWERGSEI